MSTQLSYPDYLQVSNLDKEEDFSETVEQMKKIENAQNSTEFRPTQLFPFLKDLDLSSVYGGGTDFLNAGFHEAMTDHDDDNVDSVGKSVDCYDDYGLTEDDGEDVLSDTIAINIDGQVLLMTIWR